MTRVELEQALRQQQAENAALRAELARVAPQPTVAPAAPGAEVSNQEHLAVLIREMYPAVMLVNLKGLITWVNEEFTALCGLTLPETVGHGAESVLRKMLAGGPVLNYIRTSLQAKVPFQYEVPNPKTPDGTRWIRVKVQPIFNEQRKLAMWAGLLEDITEWKKNQLTLAESERRFQALAENTPGVLYEWRKNHDGSFQFGYVSPKLVELFGLPVVEIVRLPSYVHPDDVAAFLQSMQQAVEAQAAWTHEWRLVVAGQPLRWMQGNSVVTGIDETGVMYSGILQDVTILKMAQTALRESDIRLRLTVEGFGDGAWEMNVQTREIFFSPDYKAMLGYRDEEFSNELESWYAHVHPDDMAKVRYATAAYLRNTSPLGAVEYRIRCKNGDYKWVLGRALVTARDAASNPLMLTGLQTDISELKKTQEALDVSSRWLSTIIANFQDGLVLEDENRKIVLVNEAFCNLLHVPVSPGQLMGKAGAWLTEGSKDYIKKPNQYVARITALLRRRQPVAADVVALRDGRVLQRSFTPIFDQDRYIGHLWKYEDITVRSKAEAALKRREEKYRRIIENMSLGLVEADLDDHLLYANQSFCNMTGYRNDELTGRRLSPLLLTGEDLELVESKLESRQRGIADSYEIVVTTKSGEKKWLLVSGAPVYDDRQQHVGSIGIYLDVTLQKGLEASLREAKGQAESSSRVKQEFLANMSHEIRTPMNAILGMSQLMAQTTLAGPQASYLHAITTSAENLLVIINDILDLSKIEAGRVDIERICFRPAELYAQVENNLLFKAEEKGLEFTAHIAPGVPELLLGDPYRITQILLNLVGNSVKFTERGSVNISCSLLQLLPHGEALVEFVVNDTGIGMEEEYLTQVFDNFSQEDSSVTRKFGGTGLGLGISRKLVELLGGELRMVSRKNRGTTSRFALWLPVGTAADLPQRQEAPDLSGLCQELRGKRVLLVEDNVFNRMLATVFLTNIALHVTEATNGQMAVDLAQYQTFDLVLMDVQMPVMDGYEATTVLRQQLGLTVPIIALTANATIGEREKCLAAGMNDYLAKPFQEAVLIQKVYDWVLGGLGSMPLQASTK